MTTIYSLNEQCLRFLREYEKQVQFGTEITSKDLISLFVDSNFYDHSVTEYHKSALTKSIGFAMIRSGNWTRIKNGLYKKDDFNDEYRLNLIEFLSSNLYQILTLKDKINYAGLKKYHLSSKGIGDDLYFLTESYYRSIGRYKGKHSLSDFITYNALKVIESNQPLGNKLKFEHMVPKNIYIKPIVEALTEGKLTKDLIFYYLLKYYFVCTVTAEEDKKLPMVKMSDDWDGINPFERYEKAKIALKKNNYFR